MQMIDILIYFLVSGIEYYVILLLIFSLFRLNAWKKHNQFHIVLTTLLLNIATIINIYIIKNEFYYSTILIVTSILIISLYIKTKKVSISLLSVLGLGLYLIIQTFVMGLFLASEFISEKNLTEISIYGLTIQLVSSFIVLMVCLLIKIENKGYSYELKDIKSKVAAVVISIACPFITIVLINIDNLETLSSYFIGVAIISLIVFTLYNNYKEGKEY